MQKRSFGTTKDGKEVFLYSLENKNGVKAEVTNFGAILVNLFAPDKDGNVEDVVLGFDDVTGYEVNPSYFGSTIAPSANRAAAPSIPPRPSSTAHATRETYGISTKARAATIPLCPLALC